MVAFYLLNVRGRDAHTVWSWQDGNSNSNNYSLQPKYAEKHLGMHKPSEHWSRSAAAAEDHTEWHFYRLRRGNLDYKSHGLTKTGQQKIEKTSSALISLDFGSNMKKWKGDDFMMVQPSWNHRSSVCCTSGGGGVTVWGIFSWHTLSHSLPTEHHLNATEYLTIVADHIHPFMSTLYSSAQVCRLLRHVTKLKWSLLKWPQW